MCKAREKCVQRGDNKNRSINEIDGFQDQNLLALPKQIF